MTLNLIKWQNLNTIYKVTRKSKVLLHKNTILFHVFDDTIDEIEPF